MLGEDNETSLQKSKHFVDIPRTISMNSSNFSWIIIVFVKLDLCCELSICICFRFFSSILRIVYTSTLSLNDRFFYLIRIMLKTLLLRLFIRKYSTMDKQYGIILISILLSMILLIRLQISMSGVSFSPSTSIEFDEI